MAACCLCRQSCVVLQFSRSRQPATPSGERGSSKLGSIGAIVRDFAGQVKSSGRTPFPAQEGLERQEGLGRQAATYGGVNVTAGGSGTGSSYALDGFGLHC